MHGADAVYIGGPGFGARVEAANAFADIKRLTDFAHRFNARVYMTLNTIVNDEELKDAVRLAWLAYENGVDALIVQDMGILDSDLPPIQLHASTQCDVRTAAKARFLESVGFSQVVLAREMSLEQIRESYEALQSARLNFSFTARFASAIPANAMRVLPRPAEAPTAVPALSCADFPTVFTPKMGKSSFTSARCCL